MVGSRGLTAGVRACEGMLRDYAELHGPEALIPERREPLTNEIIAGVKAVSGRVGSRTVDWGGEFWGSLRALIDTLAQTGMRNALPATSWTIASPLRTW